jgi:hypothetical protein
VAPNFEKYFHIKRLKMRLNRWPSVGAASGRENARSARCDARKKSFVISRTMFAGVSLMV